MSSGIPPAGSRPLVAARRHRCHPSPPRRRGSQRLPARAGSTWCSWPTRCSRSSVRHHGLLAGDPERQARPPYSTVMLLFFALPGQRAAAAAHPVPGPGLGRSAVGAGLDVSWPSGRARSPPPSTCLAGLLVYVLCLYAVAVRGKAWFVVTVAVVTVLGAIVIDARTSAGASSPPSRCWPGRSSGPRAERPGRAGPAGPPPRGRARAARGTPAHRPRTARHRRPPHVGDRHPGRGRAAQGRGSRRRNWLESFADIRASALSGLNELRRLLGVLRSGGADTAPQPGLAELAGLLESARSGGRARHVVGQRHPPGPAAGRGPVRLPDPAGGAEQRHAARARVRRAGGTGLRPQSADDQGAQRRVPGTAPGRPTRTAGPRGTGRRPDGAPPARPRHHRDAGARRDARRPPGGRAHRRRRFPGHRRPARHQGPGGGPP